RITSASTFSDHPSELEANEAVNNGNSEEEVGESTSDIAAMDQASDMESEVSVVDENHEVEVVDITDVSRDDPDVLENNGIVDNGVNEA
ncbi:hypothetical protein GUI04_14660, partial [Xanthomonas citri pv. citri]|nr:hypothetical protein [Xanthomonas citri pv. citri]